MDSIFWEIPHRVCLSSTVDIWFLSMSECLPKVDVLKSFLSDDEIERAQQYYFEPDSKKFIIARGALREILSRYLMQAPHTFQFDYHQGKPFLPAFPDCQFNLSHSEDVVLYVVTKTHPVGIDVEWMAENPNILDIATRFFAPAEADQLEKINERDRLTYFYKLWTQKEAFIKAIGEGLLYSLSRFIVPFEAGASMIIEEDPALAKAWQLQTFQPFENYMAALAFSSIQKEVCFYRLEF